MTKRMKVRTKLARSHQTAPQMAHEMTFLDHLHELRGRLFWVGLWFMAASVAVYPLFDHIVRLLTAPLEGKQLYYLTPAGGLSFIIKICMYIGAILVLPVIIYHLFQFVSPVMKPVYRRAVITYTLASAVLAVCGVAFAYYACLPAALHFLTRINIDQINSLLTVDSYVSFVFAYVLAGALLFQIPLVLLIINSITPLKPTQVLSYQRHVIVIAFVVAAILTPTPDVINQTIMALPIIAMYQLGVVAVWAKNRRRQMRTASTRPRPTLPINHMQAEVEVPSRPHSVAPISLQLTKVPQVSPAILQSTKSLDGFRPTSRARHDLPRVAVPQRAGVQYRRPTVLPSRRLIPTI